MAIDDFSFGRDENVFTLRKKNLLGLAGFTANPKNFRLMGGGGGGGGGPVSAVSSLLGSAGATGVGISAWVMKMFRPVPSYLVSSLAFSQS